MFRYQRDAVLIVSSLFALAAGTCESTIPNPLADVEAARSTGQQLGVAVAAIRTQDRDDAKTKNRDQPVTEMNCPSGGTRTINADGSFDLDNCAPFPGLVISGNINAIQGTDEQDIRLEFTGVRGRIGERTFSADGYIEEMENPDGSLDFSANFSTTTADDEYTDTTNIVGRLSIDALGNMTGGFATPAECPTDLACGDACNLDGFNMFSLLSAPEGFEAAIQTACAKSQSIDCSGFSMIPMLLINGSDEAVNILTPEEIRGAENLLQPGGSRSVCVFFQAGGVLNVRVQSEAGLFVLEACPFTDNPIFDLDDGRIQWTGDFASFGCNGAAFE